MAHDENKNVTITSTMASIITANVGAVFTPGMLTGVFRNEFDIFSGCIEHLYYLSDDDDLRSIRVGGVQVSPVNLKDFRDRLREAACCRQCISFCVGKEDRKMVMLNVYPCQECKPSEKCDCPA
jgi:hypothetical protein